MEIITKPITIENLQEKAQELFGDMVKAVVDVKREIMVINGELHADLEQLLLQDGSAQEDLWGVNFYPELETDEWLEFDSMINLRPFHGNLSRGVDDSAIQQQIRNIVNKLVKR